MPPARVANTDSSAASSKAAWPAAEKNEGVSTRVMPADWPRYLVAAPGVPMPSVAPPSDTEVTMVPRRKDAPGGRVKS